VPGEEERRAMRIGYERTTERLPGSRGETPMLTPEQLEQLEQLGDVEGEN